MGDVTSEGQRLIANWLRAKQEEERTSRELSARERDTRDAARALAAWLLPDDAKPGEKIAVWWEDNLFQATKAPAPVGEQAFTDEVIVRKRGKRFNELAARVA
jgi:hypothetical protein